MDDRQRRDLFASLRSLVKDRRVVEAMEQVPREAFLSREQHPHAYEDVALPIEEGQTISQPRIVAMMVEAMELTPQDRVLEVGTGSGYQAAVLSKLAREVVTVERVPYLTEVARERLVRLGWTNVRVLQAGEALGCPEEAPFDAIVVAAGAPFLPMALVQQLKTGGRLVIPVGSRLEQQLLQVRRTERGYSVRSLGPCKFVPLIGESAWQQEDDHGREGEE